MHQPVRDIWVEFNEPLEGLLNLMYADILGLVTTGMGSLIDPVALALPLPWELPDGSRAQRAHILEAWYAVKRDPLCAKKGWKYAAKLPRNNVRLSRVAVTELVFRKLDQNDATMAVQSSHPWDERPADAQLAVHSLMWAMGPHFWRKFPKFTASFMVGDYAGCAEECAIAPAKGTVIERNRRNRVLFENAARVVAEGLDPSELIWSDGSAPHAA